MAFTRRSRYANQQNRRGQTGPGTRNQIVRRPPITITTATVATPNVTLTFDQPVVVTGIPSYLSDAGDTPDLITSLGPTQVELHYPAAVTGITVPFEDPGIRNTGGGYVLPGTFPVG